MENTLSVCKQLVEDKNAVKALRTLMTAENMSFIEAKKHIDQLIESRKKR